MPMIVPTRVMRDAVALATAAKNIDEPGGKQKLLDILPMIDASSLYRVTLALARLAGLNTDEETLQRIGQDIAVDHDVIAV